MGGGRLWGVGHSIDRASVLVTVRSWVQLVRSVPRMTRSLYLPSCSHGLALVHALARAMQLSLQWYPPPRMGCLIQGVALWCWEGLV